jgi:coproporphyrinogen III oxidase-like Fe-S oxidoreductase
MTCGDFGPDRRAIDLSEPESLVGNYFVSTYPPFSAWTEAATPGYRGHLECAGSPGTPLGLYVHIPFCADRCHYCYYLSHDDRLADMDRYLDALVVELATYAKTPAFAGRSLSFVYFGGGTPSLLSERRLARLLPLLQEILPWHGAREVTFECAPKSVTEGKLTALRDHGVTRISLGAQQMNDDVLRANGRVHLTGDVERAYAAIRRVGFDIVNLDLMIGLVRETESTFCSSLERVIEMAPDSITTYLLEIPRNTPLWRSVRDATLDGELSTWETKRARLRRGRERLEGAGYIMTSAYAAVRDPDRHAFVYQRAQYHGADLLGIGASAFSHVGGWNQQNHTSVADYVATVARGELPLSRAYSLDDRERLIREFVLQLKLGAVECSEFRSKFGVDVAAQFAEPIANLVSRRWLAVDGDRVTMTREGILRVDRILPVFYLPEHRGIRYS